MTDSYIDPRTLPDDEVAHHEAGHAVAACVLQEARPLVEVTLDSKLEGFVAHSAQEPFESFLGPENNIPITPEFHSMVLADVSVIYAGPIAERRYVGNAAREHDGIISDYMQANELVDEFLPGEQRRIPGAEAIAEQLVDEHWDAICAVADALVEHRTLGRARVEELIALATPD